MNESNEFKIRRQLLQMEMLYEIGLAINESLDPTYVAQEVLNRALVMVDARGGLLLVADQEEGPLKLIGQVGLDELDPDTAEILQLAEMESAWKQRQLVHRERDTASWRHLCIVPLESQQEVKGLLIVADKEHREGAIGPFSESDETLLHSFAYQAGIALHNARLHHRLEEAYEQVRQAQKMEILGQLTGGVAHDFNNLLTVINGYSELGLTHVDEEDPLYIDLDEINQAGERAAALIRQLLSFSRHQALQPDVLDLNQVIAEMSKMLGRLIGESVELVFVPDPSLGQVLADPGQIEQVIMNLAINARDAMPRGGTLKIETGNAELDEDSARPPGDYVLISVSDTGTGMDAGTRARIFEPFFTTKAPDEGTGLGLAMVHNTVRQSRGHIEVDSEVGEGTTFRIYLPRLDSADRAAEVPAERAEMPGGQEMILVVEDEAALLNLVRIVLEARGYTVLTGTTPEAVLPLFEEHQDEISLLLTDVVMPGMNGRELAERLEALRPDLKVVYMSGYPDSVLAQCRVLDSGAPLLQKPFTSEALVRTVHEVLDA